MKRLSQIVLLVISLIAMGGAVQAQAKPTGFLKAKDQKLKPLLKNTAKNKGQILKVVNQMLDFDSLCKASLGKHWDTRSDDERKDFSSTLKALIEKNLIDRLKDTSERKITYESEKLSGDKASVVTLVSSGDDPRAEKTEIEYKLQKKGKKWGVVDMVTDGVSLVNNYRSQFNKIITEDGWAVLMKKMKDKLAE